MGVSFVFHPREKMINNKVNISERQLQKLILDYIKLAPGAARAWARAWAGAWAAVGAAAWNVIVKV